MTARDARPRPSRLAALLLAALTALASPTSAQQTRVQVAGTDQLSSHVHVMLGADEILPIGGGPCPPGGPVCVPPDWEVLVGAYGGFVIDEVPLSVYAHVGLQYRLTADLGLALLGFGFMNPLQGGAALRLDALDVGALKAGYGWGGGDDEGVLVGVEVAAQFLLDLFR